MSSDNLIGTRIGTYEITAVIGTGGMATVYRAIQGNLGRAVAIKMLKMLSPAFGDDVGFMRNFEREARVTAQLEHPSIIPIYEFGAYQNRPYLVMRLLEGGTLAGRLRDGARFNPVQAEIVLSAVAGALDHAHRRGVIHRDIKPGNVLFDLEDKPYLSDFGIAQLSSYSESGLTGATMITGTPLYMAPEQWIGAVMDARADIYALGILVYEMLTGRTPFKVETPYALMQQHINEAPPPLHEIAPDLAPELTPIVLKALMKGTADRYATAGAFADAFRVHLRENAARYAGLDTTLPPARAAMRAPNDPITAIFDTFAPPAPPMDKKSAATPLPPMGAPPMVAPPQSAYRGRSARATSSTAIILAGAAALIGVLIIALNGLTPDEGGSINVGAAALLIGVIGIGIGAAAFARTNARTRSLPPPKPTLTDTQTWYEIPLTMREAAESPDVRAPDKQDAAPTPLLPVTESSKEQIAPPPPPRERDALYDTREFDVYTMERGESEPLPIRRFVPPPFEPFRSSPVPPPAVRRARVLSDFAEGDEFAGYRLLKRLDSGDANRVYHAINTRNERPVALKLMQGANERAFSRFKQESLILDSLQHPHIVQFLDFGVEEGCIYLVMPLLTGRSLKSRITAGGLSVPVVIDWTSKFTSALTYIHARAIVHRDFRPVNIVFSADETPYLTEFSIAKRIGEEQALGLTMAGEVLGTPGYIAPEQRLMGEVSPASDQYSLAVVAFEMLTGVMPFDAPKSMMDNLYAKAKRATTIRAALPSAVDEVLLRGMALRPDERYDDVRAFCTALEAALMTPKAVIPPPLVSPDLSPSRSTAPTGHVFISYSRAQKEYARRIADWLTGAGFDVWIDDQIDYGDDWWRTIVHAIETCGAFLVIMSPEAEASDWVQREVGNALKFKKPLYPLLYTGENWSLFVWTQYADVRVLTAASGTIEPPLPPADFLERLAKSARRGASVGREIIVSPQTPRGEPVSIARALPQAPAPSLSAPPAPFVAASAPQAPPAGVAWRPALPPDDQPKPPRHEIIRILFLSADPKNERRLRLSDELHDVDEYLRKSEYRDRFDLKEAWAVQIADLQGYLLRYKPHIVHFSGHGSREGAILLQDAMGNAAPVKPAALGNLFQTLKDNIRCVVLNACYSELQARAIVGHIDCVIGMSQTIRDSSAITFAGQFYQALGYGRHIGTAFNLGKNALDLYATGESETPHMLIRDGLAPEDVTLF
jgi:serine/threonine-protein kinase